MLRLKTIEDTYSFGDVRYFRAGGAKAGDHRVHDLCGEDDGLFDAVALVDYVLLYEGNIFNLEL